MNQNMESELRVEKMNFEWCRDILFYYCDIDKKI